MRSLGLTLKLLHILQDPRLAVATMQALANVLGELLSGTPDLEGIMRWEGNCLNNIHYSLDVVDYY